MRNLVERGKRVVEPIEAELEPNHLYPLLIGKAVRAWSATPSAWVLLAQDPWSRKGIDPATLRAEAPGVFEYLSRFETLLRSRAAFLRYYTKPGSNGRVVERGPFYSMFDVGAYSLAPVKVVWNRMGHRLAAAVVTEREGKAIQPQETHCLFGLDDLEEAHYLAALLNSRWAQRALEAVGQVGGKGFATPRSVHRLRLPAYDRSNALALRLATLSRFAHRQATGDRKPGVETLTELNRVTARFWGFDDEAFGTDDG